MVNHEIRPPTASRAAQISIAFEYAASKATGSAYWSPESTTATGNAATASSEPARATALLTPLAMPVRSSGAAARTVAVSGATIRASPCPNSVTGGSTPVQYDVPTPTCDCHASPTAITFVPTV